MNGRALPNGTRATGGAHSAAEPVAVNERPHATMVVFEWEKLQKHIQNKSAISVDGSSLDMASTTAVARHRISAILSSDSAVRNRINKNVHFLDEHMANGNTVYGINTGFGGSADVRCGTNQMGDLQRSLLQHLQCGVVSLPPPTSINGFSSSGNTMSQPEEWVRATMLIRCNSLARGHSAVRAEVIESLITLLNHNIIPVVPLRGSISASGDLSPLSYLAGALEGNPNIYVSIGECGNATLPREIISADKALQRIGLAPIKFGPKEGLGLVNGTATSCAVASITLHSLHNLLSLSQVLTAMGVEAILGTATSFASFISDIRPHPGQAEVASNISYFLSGSELASGVFRANTAVKEGLYQDRYSIRTAPQWLGPFMEDLMLAHKQLSTERNSTTDNPLIDAENGHVYHGGNFQAVSVTSAMEKSRLAAQAIGRMLFSQCTELLNPTTNRGLPPNLCADDPSLSFTMKGLDTNMASYMSELSFLANPVHNHVVSAEMGNQALNSLALISARYTDTAVELVTLMCAVYLYVLCQALDLRAMHQEFERELERCLTRKLTEEFPPLEEYLKKRLHADFWAHVQRGMLTTTTLDVRDRFTKVMNDAQSSILAALCVSYSIGRIDTPEGSGRFDLAVSIRDFCKGAAYSAVELYDETRKIYFQSGRATPLLGTAGKKMYTFVRETLGVPMHRGIQDHPTPRVQPNGTTLNEGQNANGVGDEWRKKTVGHWVGIIFEAIRDGRAIGVVVECLKEAGAECV